MIEFPTAADITTLIAIAVITCTCSQRFYWAVATSDRLFYRRMALL